MGAKGEREQGLSAGVPFEAEYRVRRHDGAYRWFLVHYNPLRDDRGNYVYVGRSDRVIKRHGVRLSLVEVTEALGGIDGVASAACTTFDLEGDLGVVAFVVPDGELTTPVAVRQAASERLSEMMLPDQFVFVANLPLTSSSKVDERRLLKEAGLSPPTKGPEPSVSFRQQ